MESKRAYKRRLDGVVVSNKCDKTITVKVIRRFKHLKYSKFVYESKKYHAHDEKNNANEGDKVTIIASKPYSKTKKWELFKVNN